MSSYLTYYLGWMVLAYVVHQPVLLVGVVFFLLFRQYIPDPGAIVRALRRASSLKHQVGLNAANVTARRDLAIIYLDLRRPKAALALLEQALARDPDDAELLFLLGRALHRTGRHVEALAPLVRSVEIRPKLRYGEPYLVAGDALLAAGRIDEATDAYERFAKINHSDVGVHVQLARAHARAGDRVAVRASLASARDTWNHIPWSIRRRNLGRWFETQWLRARFLGDPIVIVSAAAIATLLFFGARVAAPHVRQAFAAASPMGSALLRSNGIGSNGVGSNDDRGETTSLVNAFAQCGSQSTGDLEGKYDVAPEPPLPADVVAALPPERRAALAELRATEKERYQHFEILSDRIHSGKGLVQEFCLTRMIERTPTSLHAEAVWHEDVGDPGDASLVEVRIERQGDGYRFAFNEPGEAAVNWMILKRKVK